MNDYQRNILVDGLGVESNRGYIERQLATPEFEAMRKPFREELYPVMAELAEKFEEEVPASDLPKYRKKVTALIKTVKGVAKDAGFDMTKNAEDQSEDKQELFERLKSTLIGLEDLDEYWGRLERLKPVLWSK